MNQTVVHLLNANGVTVCNGRVRPAQFATHDPLAVTCHACIGQMELQPS